ncbi:hypothetical protein SAMN04488065_0575 [Haloplanus vescus]|uniref:Uncharacterized protein n=1 Tax=Haloplanus vescus TaxID=555874 RepID=A0A1H3W564_9EURY|nr:hypothetical protein [Haloplanus vescus]SDZ82217.1 hypothetical protein SAMN04488065_0575 [Haloplanus vescus]
MRLKQQILEDIVSRFVEAGVTDRHVNQEYSLYTNVYRIDDEDPNLQTLFDLAIQNRAQPLSTEDYRTLSSQFELDEFLDYDTRSEAFDDLIEIENIGPKIVDEFLRKTVHVFGVKSEWESDLCVPLDTNVVQGLVKTGAIDLEDEDWETDLSSNYQNVVNTDPTANPRKKIGYSELQDGFEKAASEYDLPRIVFDELWLEHSRFISNPLLQSESTLSDMILSKFQIGG